MNHLVTDSAQLEFAEIHAAIDKQRTFFATGATRDVAYRLKHLKGLQAEIMKRSDDISAALHKDLKKSEPESYVSEISTVLNELKDTIKKLPKWVKPRKVGTPLGFRPASSQIRPEPYGNTLIIGPWNYPFSLLIKPMFGAVAAGNTIVCKPSEHAPHSAQICKEIIEAVFDPQYVTCIEGGIPETTAILTEKWDYIFFTGSTHVGRIVYQAAAKHLTPVTLELGGKSPCIIDNTANLETAASRIVSSKFFNNGQICIAPDYLLIQSDVRDELVSKIIERIKQFYGDNPQKSDDYGRIINERNFDRLLRLIDQDKVIYGGESDRADKFIAPTIMGNVTLDDAVMQEEIFGPILPVMSWQSLDEVKEIVRSLDKPLVLYMYSKSNANVEEILANCSSGGVTVNDCLLQYVNKNLPFGGVGASGLGAYHGPYTFETFSHMKSEVHKAAGMDSSLRYPPLEPNFKTLKFVADNLF
ncbi:MAG: aldehyde dehydrogenase [Chloroflexota bacterium]